MCPTPILSARFDCGEPGTRIPFTGDGDSGLLVCRAEAAAIAALESSGARSRDSLSDEGRAQMFRTRYSV